MFKKKSGESKPVSDRETLIESLMFLILDRIGFFRQVRNFIDREITSRVKKIIIGIIFLSVAAGFLFSAALAANLLIYYGFYYLTESIVVSVISLLASNIILGFIALLTAFHWFAKAGRSIIRKNSQR
jgi:hypothetical protein